MILERIEYASGTVRFISPDGTYALTGLHPATAECYERGCVVHSPSTFALSDAPLNWRQDRHQFERICKHGVGHPDADQAEYNTWHGMAHENIHGCCPERCCA